MKTPEDYGTLLGRLDEWFDRGCRAAGGVVPCRGGCSACCHGPFDISVADAELVGRAVAALDPSDRETVVARSRALLARMQTLEPGWHPPYDIAELGEERFDHLADALAAAPCPLLDEAGRCRIYRDRPLVCRLIGLGMATPAGRIIANECPIQHTVPGYAELAPAGFELEAFEEVEAEELTQAARRTGRTEAFETTIAAAIVMAATAAPNGSPGPRP